MNGIGRLGISVVLCIGKRVPHQGRENLVWLANWRFVCVDWENGGR